MTGETFDFDINIPVPAPSAPVITAGGMKAPTAATATAQGTTGAQTVTYRGVSVSTSGKRSLATANITVTDAHATIDGTNSVLLEWTDSPWPDLDHVEWYRTVGGADQGYIGSVDAGEESLLDDGIAAAGTPLLPVATTRKYKIVTLTQDGHSPASAEGTSAVGPEALSADTPMVVDWAAVTNADQYQPYRTDTLITKGLLATVDAPTSIYTDEGGVGDGTNPPTADTMGTGDSSTTLPHRDKTVQIYGTFVGTLKIQGTLDGVNWVDEGADVTAPAFREVSKTYVEMRIKITAWTSGSVGAKFGGHR